MGKKFFLKQKNKKSLRTIIKRGMAVIAILLFCFCIFFIYSAWKQLNNQVLSVYKDMLELQVQEVENEFEKAQEDLAVFVSTSENLWILKNLPLGTDYNFEKLQINKQLRENVNRYSYVNGIFIIDKNNDNIISQYNSGTSYTEMLEIKEFFLDKTDKDKEFEINRNFIECINGVWYYFYLLPMDEITIGNWCNLNKIFGFMEGKDSTYTGAAFELMGVCYQTGQGSADSFVSVNGSVTNIKYSIFLSKSEIYIAIVQLMLGNIIICIAIFVIVMLVLMWIGNHVVRSVTYMEKELEIIGSNNLEHRIEKEGELTEFQMLYDSLNEMLEQVCRLKIQVYEEQMEKQKIYTSYLILQMNPHFYVNSLNVIHNLAQIKNYALIEKMTSCLSGYLNYMFRKDENEATIGEELQHINNFLEIQRIRYAENCTFSAEIETEELYGAKIPLLLLHTFIENSIKHSKNQIRDLHIYMSVQMELSPEGNKQVNILFADNGKGFEETVLKQINENNSICKADGEHIGIKNLRERALQYFEGHFAMHCYNDNGACVRLEFPYINIKND